MDREEQKELVSALCNDVRDEIQFKITIGKIPENWDGIELRELVADKFAQDTYFGKRWSNTKRGTRYKDYKNTVLINNL